MNPTTPTEQAPVTPPDTTEQLNAVTGQIKGLLEQMRAATDKAGLEQKIQELNQSFVQAHESVTTSSIDARRKLQQQMDLVLPTIEKLKPDLKDTLREQLTVVQQNIETMQGNVAGQVFALLNAPPPAQPLTTLGWLGNLFKGIPGYAESAIGKTAALVGINAPVKGMFGNLGQMFKGLWHRAVLTVGAKTHSVFGMQFSFRDMLGGMFDFNYHEWMVKRSDIENALRSTLKQVNGRRPPAAQFSLPEDWDDDPTVIAQIEEEWRRLPATPPTALGQYVSKQFLLAADKLPKGGEVTIGRIMNLVNFNRPPVAAPVALPATAPVAPVAPAPAPTPVPAPNPVPNPKP